MTRSTNFQAIGTKWGITVFDTLSDVVWSKLRKDIKARIAIFDKNYSRFRTDSLVTRIFNRPGEYKLPGDAFTMMRFYHQLYEVTSGRVTPLIGQVMVEAGYDTAYSLQKRQLHQPPAWKDAMTYNKAEVTTTQPVLLDFGAAGKGYLVDIVGELLETGGARDYYINAGGDIRYRSSQGAELKIGLENPQDTAEAIGVVKLTNASLCSSAGSKRKWSGLHHIIDPVSLSSPTEVIATWVIAKDTMTADGLATALFFTKPSVLAKQFQFSYALLCDDMSLQTAVDFPASIFEVTK